MYELYGLAAVSVILLAIVIPLLLASYILKGIALYTMGKNRGFEHAWFAWIPFVNMYLFGELINDKVAFDTLIIPSAKWILLFAPIVSGALTQIPYIGWIFSIIVLIYSFAAEYRLFKLYAPENAVLYLVLSIVFFWIGFLAPIFMVVIRNKEPQEYLNIV